MFHTIKDVWEQSYQDVFIDTNSTSNHFGEREASFSMDHVRIGNSSFSRNNKHFWRFIIQEMEWGS